MQNSLDRIFDGLCSTLRERVLPEVSDPWVRIQVEAAVGLLAHLAVRVEWRCADLAEEVAATRALLAEATARGGTAPELLRARDALATPAPGASDNARLVAARSDLLEALAGVQEWAAREGDPAAASLREPLRRLLADRLEAELALLAGARRVAVGDTAAPASAS